MLINASSLYSESSLKKRMYIAWVWLELNNFVYIQFNM